LPVPGGATRTAAPASRNAVRTCGNTDRIGRSGIASVLISIRQVSRIRPRHPLRGAIEPARHGGPPGRYDRVVAMRTSHYAAIPAPGQDESGS
jgi:hypothetical protein